MRERVSAGQSGFPPAYLDRGASSFTDFLTAAAPELLPGRRPLPPVPSATSRRTAPPSSPSPTRAALMAGDRRATMGNLIASRDIEKVHPADAYSLIGIAGTAGIGIELMRLFQVELEHYEKIEGTMLSLDGKANRLAAMIRGNLGAAMQGLAVVPLFAGFDLDAARPGPGRPDLQLRRRGRPLRGDRLRRDRLRLAVRQVRAEEDLPAAACRADAAARPSWRRSTTPPTTTPRPAGPT